VAFVTKGLIQREASQSTLPCFSSFELPAKSKFVPKKMGDRFVGEIWQRMPVNFELLREFL
jgi:hypothetical protein